ncbi:class I SAM-dependent RNA methyltransferase [uncultured Roseovarius sp.]|uniref:class I SAM-dependent RNA methyltransferase n=1 Tax=uncultured Roseovarius sp. TaxID=293344 RepID=UPI002606E4EF|nr:class I SAM-dependent RNA methyltransferase [uncultured Roseovarius sp.]
MREIDIIRLGQHGDGIAAGPLFAPLTLPGERVTGKLDGQTLNEVRIVHPSPDRVSAPCRHFRSCGGCQLQHASDTFVADWKQSIVRTALAAHGISAEFEPVHVSPPQSRRRATFAARRTKKGAMSGFHARGSDVIIEIPECHLLHPDVLRGSAVACDLAMAGASRKAGIDVSVTLSLTGLDVAVSGGKALDASLRVTLADLAEKHDLARLAWGDEILVTRRPPVQMFGQARVVPPPGAFLQATADGQSALLARTETIIKGARRVVDLFAGCGTFALPIAGHAQVHAVEADSLMLEALDASWRKTKGLRAVSVETRDLFRRPLLPDELSRFDAAVIDPPRAGADAQIAEIAGAGVPLLAYVSCNPTSFARDVKVLLESGYAMGPILVVDQFRWSTHVELVAGFTLNKK